MRLTVLVGVVCVVGGGFYGKLLHDRDVQEERAQRAIEERPNAPPPPPIARPTPPPPPPRPKPVVEPDRPQTLLPTEERALEKARAAIAAGRFDDADRSARDAAADGGPALRAAAAQLGEKARLLGVLTRAIEPHPFAKATDLSEVVLASGVTHVCRVLQESDTSVVLALADGRQIDVRPERISKREKLAPDAWRTRARAEIEKKKGEGEAGALELYHLACESFEAALPELGVPLLERALALPGGGAIVDVYGSGDLAALHRAQERLRTEAGAPSPALLAEGPRRSKPRPAPSPAPPPAPRVSDVPQVEVPPDVPPSPTPTPPPPPVPVADDPQAPPAAPAPASPPPPPAQDGLDPEGLERNAKWQAAHEAYNQAVQAYRDAFAGRSAQQKEGIRHARALLEKARESLEQIPELGADAAQTWDAFSARVNALLRDVKKRQAATGS
jgi:hypothetical protein